MKIYEYSECGWEIEFIYSPYFEMLCSLHVITKPDHHLNRLNWYRDIKENMDHELYKEIMYFGTYYFEWCSAMEFYKYFHGINDLNITASLDYINEMNIVDFVYIMLGELLNKETVEYHILRGSYNIQGQEITEQQAEIFSNAEGFRRRLLACLKKYYYLYFEKELRFFEPLLVRKLKKEATICDEMGIKEFVKTIHTRIEVNDKAFLFHKYKLFTVPFDSIDKIIIVISSFIDPHLLIGIDNERILQFTIRVNLERASEEVPFDLFMTMKALGDETRLKVLRCVYKKINSTQAIAKELGITEAGVSKHLKIMYEAGVLRKRRDGNFINYIIEREVIDRIPMDMYQYLDN